MQLKEAREIVLASVAEWNAGRLPAERIVADDDTLLFGPSGVLDSLGLVELIVAIEENVFKATGISVSLASDQALSQARSPFRSAQTLSEFLCQLVSSESGQ